MGVSRYAILLLSFDWQLPWGSLWAIVVDYMICWLSVLVCLPTVLWGTIHHKLHMLQMGYCMRISTRLSRYSIETIVTAPNSISAVILHLLLTRCPPKGGLLWITPQMKLLEYQEMRLSVASLNVNSKIWERRRKMMMMQRYWFLNQQSIFWRLWLLLWVMMQRSNKYLWLDTMWRRPNSISWLGGLRRFLLHLKIMAISALGLVMTVPLNVGLQQRCCVLYQRVTF